MRGLIDFVIIGKVLLSGKNENNKEILKKVNLI